MKKNYGNVIVLVSLNEKCTHELAELRNSPFLSGSENVYFVHIYSKSSEKHLPLHINKNDIDNVQAHVLSTLQGVYKSILPQHKNKSQESHCQCIFNGDDKICAIEYIKKVNADLAIVATRGEQDIEGLFTNSFAYWLVSHAPCDVFVIRPKQ